MNDMDNILSDNDNRHIPEDKLIAYLEGRLTAEEQHEIERYLADEGMESDAIEGLQQLPATETRHSVTKLNTSLRKKLHDKKRKRRTPQSNQVTLIAIIIVLILIIAAYLVLRKAM